MSYPSNALIADFPAWHYADFEQRALQIAQQLRHDNIRGVALWLEDGAHLACTLLAAWHADVRVLLLPNTTEESLEWAAQQVDLWLADDVQALPQAVAFTDYAANTLLQKNAENRPLFDRHSQAEIWLKTSGSSGEAKSIIKTAEQMWLSADVLAQTLPFAAGNQFTALSSVSIQHIYGLTVHIMMSLVQGWKIGRKQQFFPECLIGETHGKTIWISSPAMLSKFDWHSAQIKDLCGVISSGGALSEETSDLMRQTLKQPVIEIYGSTETGPIACRADTGLWQPMPYSQVGADENGTLWLEAKWATDRQQTADAVEFYPDGFALLGRVDRIVKIGDKRTSLVSVEQALCKHQGVNDCYIAMHPNQPRLATWVELNEIAITLLREKGRKALIEELKQHLSHTQEKTAIPRFWRFSDKLPRNSQSKIIRADFERVCTETVREPLWEKGEQQDGWQIFTGKVPLDLVYLKGHFADFPLVPGVVEMQWACDKAEELLGKPLVISRMDNLKFQKFIQPNDSLALRLKWDEAKQRMQFQLKSNGEMSGSGAIVLDNEMAG